jgi:hypothetical protein
MPLVWIRLLPSTLHKSIRSEFEWVNKNICQVQGMDWESAKKLFIDHWQRSDSGLVLLEQYKNLKHGDYQNVNEFINEFHQQLELNGIDEDSHVCDEFLMKLNPWIKRQVLLQLKIRDQTASSLALGALPRTLNIIEEMARTIDATSTRPHVKSNEYEEKHSVYKQRFKRKESYQNKGKEHHVKYHSSADKKNLHCENHPDHSTQDCRLNQKRVKQEPEPYKAPQPFKKYTAKTPNDENWVCVVCKQKKPGHYPTDCPQKNLK